MMQTSCNFFSVFAHNLALVVGSTRSSSHRGVTSRWSSSGPLSLYIC